MRTLWMGLLAVSLTGCLDRSIGFELHLVRRQPPAPGTHVVVECALTPSHGAAVALVAARSRA